MQIIDLATKNKIAEIPCGCVIAFGFFDGVHVGHRALIEAARAISGANPVSIWTFEDMPKIPPHSRLTTNREKCDALYTSGADYVIFEDFDSIHGMSGREFFEKNIANRYSPSAVVCGYNFRFGDRASSNADDLKSYAAEHGIKCAVVPEVKMQNLPVSSSIVRESIRGGDMIGAAQILGRPYSLTSAVESGRQIGTKIGHPTANLRFPNEKLMPPRGVYSCTVLSQEDGWQKAGVCNIGSRPTVSNDSEDVTLEVYIFDHEGDLYGKTITVSLVELLRRERKFDSLDKLSAQISKDGDSAKKSLAENGYIL